MISTFGDKLKPRELNITNIDFFENSNNFAGKLSVRAYVMNKIMSDFKAFPLSERQINYCNSKNYQLSDEEAGTSTFLKIDMLIGADCINDFYKNNSIKIPGGSVLKQTWGNKYILSGPVDCDQDLGFIQHFSPPRVIMVNCLRSDRKFLQKNSNYTKVISSLFQKTYSEITSPDELNFVEEFRNLESLGIYPMDNIIDPVLSKFNEETVFDGTRYIVKLPFNDLKFKLSQNFYQAFMRLLSGLKRRNKPKFEEETKKYDQSFQEELKLGILEKVGTLGHLSQVKENVANNPQHYREFKLDNGLPCCYLPHQAVYKASTGKFRRVHDGKAKPYKGAYSINDVLETGPNLTSSILQILLGFRKGKFAVKADIEKAFPQVAIAEEHRDALRCLWIEGEEVVVYRFARLPFGLSCSPFVLQATLRRHLENEEVDERMFSSFVHSIYVDDFLYSDNDKNAILKRKEFITDLFRKCGMNFRDWTSNCAEARELFAKLEERDSKINEGALGMNWNTETDRLSVCTERLKEKIKLPVKTKRDLWRIVPSIFDPLGYVSPFVLLGKIILSEACKKVKKWDEKLPENLRNEFWRWSREFELLTGISWNRFVGIENPKKVQLYGCCDASSYALGACVYLVSTAQDGKITSNLIMSKTRTAPLNETSIPRLELISAVLLNNIISHVKEVFEIPEEDIVRFTDSADVLFWLYSGHLGWKSFVANQIKKLRKGSDVTSWRHIDTSENPADLCSRGESVRNLQNSDFWSSGPKFWKSGDLSSGLSKVKGFDKHYKDLMLTDNCLREMQSESRRELSLDNDSCTTLEVNSLHILQNLAEGKHLGKRSESSGARIDLIINPEKLKSSSYSYLMFVTEVGLNIARKFVEKWKNKMVEKKKLIPVKFIEERLPFMSEVVDPELLWIQAAQRKYLPELFALANNHNAKVSKNSRSIFYSHKVFLDKEMNVLRVTTRNEKSLISFSGVYPILLPTAVRTEDNKWEDCSFTKKLVLKRHYDLGHAGVPDTLSNIRSEFWLLQGRSFVQRILRHCVMCKKVSGPTYSAAPSPSLPEFRVTRDKPFAGTGVDYLGPFWVKDSPRGKKYKAWYLSFVCGSTRAIHIEAVKSRSVGDFVLAISRFMDSHGIPKSFISDHEGSFKNTSECLEQIVKSSRVQNLLKNNRASWSFYTAKSPNKGGFIERLNSSIKKSFYKSIGRKFVDFEVFRSMAVHAASVINDRPLTYLYSDINSQKIALTPSMLIRGYNIKEPPYLNFQKMRDPVETKISESYIISETIKSRFWKVWSQQYLSELYERHIREKRAQLKPLVPSLGEVVLISEDLLPRRQWRLGRVIGINEKRGVIREVTVQTLSPKGKQITKLKRSPEKLVPVLESQNDFGILVDGPEKKIAPSKLIPLEEGCEQLDSKIDFSGKYNKAELQKFKRKNWLPPYSLTKAFRNPSSINTGPEEDFVNQRKQSDDVEIELRRDWGK